MAQHFGINILKPLWTQEVQDGIHILPLREHTFDSPFSLTNALISKFKAFKRILTLSFLRLFPQYPFILQASSAFIPLHPFHFPGTVSLPPLITSLHTYCTNFPTVLPPSSTPLLHTFSYCICLSRLPVSFCPFPSLNSKSTIVSLSYLWIWRFLQVLKKNCKNFYNLSFPFHWFIWSKQYWSGISLIPIPVWITRYMLVNNRTIMIY